MGGRGSSSGMNANNNIVPFKSKTPSNRTGGGWDYRGDRERVDKLIAYANSAKTANTIQRAASALKKEDEHITTLLKTAKEDGGDTRALMTLRRRVREQRKNTRL